MAKKNNRKQNTQGSRRKLGVRSMQKPLAIAGLIVVAVFTLLFLVGLLATAARAQTEVTSDFGLRGDTAKAHWRSTFLWACVLGKLRIHPSDPATREGLLFLFEWPMRECALRAGYEDVPESVFVPWQGRMFIQKSEVPKGYHISFEKRTPSPSKGPRPPTPKSEGFLAVGPGKDHLWWIGSAKVNSRVNCKLMATPHGPRDLVHDAHCEIAVGEEGKFSIGKLSPPGGLGARFDETLIGPPETYNRTWVVKAHGMIWKGRGPFRSALQIGFFGDRCFGGNLSKNDCDALYFRATKSLPQGVIFGISLRAAESNARGFDLRWKRGNLSVQGEMVTSQNISLPGQVAEPGETSEWYLRMGYRFHATEFYVRHEDLRGGDEVLTLGRSLALSRDVLPRRLGELFAKGLLLRTDLQSARHNEGAWRSRFRLQLVVPF